MKEDEVYPNAPVVLVTMEIRHPPAPLTASENQALKRLLADTLPIERTGQDLSFAIVGPSAPPTTTVEQFVRYVNRESTMAAAIKKQAIIVETSVYNGWQSFCELLMLVVEARAEISSIIGVERVGLRYIDEIRVPEGPDGTIHWSDWIRESLLGPQADAPIGLSLADWQGTAVYGEAQTGKSLVLRYGPRVGYAVDPSSDLRRGKHAEPGPFFLMDIDSFWTPDGVIPEYEKNVLLSIYQDLHHPVRILFEDMITDRLRNEVLRIDG
jgi:uncharacterized protein (TIGR04255 family)